MKVIDVLDFEDLTADAHFDPKKYTILVVDDEKQNLVTFKANFRKSFTIVTAQSAKEGLEILSQEKIGVILTDQRMPEMTGLQFLKIVKDKHPDVTRMMVTGFNDPDVMIQAVNDGSIYRFALKPWKEEEMSMFLRQCIDHYRLKDHNRMLINNLDVSFFQTIKAFAMAVDAKDDYTRTHSGRVSELSVRLGKELQLNVKQLKSLRIAGLLHDVGKIGVPDQILNKPAALTDEEFKTVKSHPALGRAILQSIKALKTVAKIVGSHHERFDGKGYPVGLVGEDIPLEGRIIALADAFDSMFLDRKYRKGLSIKVIIQEFKKFSGFQFDPNLVNALFKIIEKEFGESIAVLETKDLSSEVEQQMRQNFDYDTHVSTLLVDEEIVPPDAPSSNTI